MFASVGPFGSLLAQRVENPCAVKGGELFPLVQGKTATPICVDADAHATVHVAARLLAEDMERVSGVKLTIIHRMVSGPVIVIGKLETARFWIRYKGCLRQRFRDNGNDTYIIP